MTIEINDLQFIPEVDVPIYKRTKWDIILNKIPNGQALVIQSEQIHPNSVRQALRRRQNRGQFKNLKLVVREINDNLTSYIINSERK